MTPKNNNEYAFSDTSEIDMDEVIILEQRALEKRKKRKKNFYFPIDLEERKRIGICSSTFLISSANVKPSL